MDSKKKWEDVKDVIRNFEDSYGNEFDLGSYWKYNYLKDIKYVSFALSRYKFASKMLRFRENLSMCELGCNEALGALMFKQNINLKKYLGVDLDEKAIEWNRRYLPEEFEFEVKDFMEEIFSADTFDAIVSLDVIEHIDKEREDKFCQIIVDRLKPDGVAIIGTPSICMTPYASETSKRGHVNMFDQKRLYGLMNKYFNNVFIFNMNDEVVNTGFDSMACYIFAVCAGIK